MTDEEKLQYLQYLTGCIDIFKHYGEEKQKLQFIQELAELVQAITKNDPDNFAEELADVQVMIDQFTLSNPILDKAVETIQHKKVQRQLNRIRKEIENE